MYSKEFSKWKETNLKNSLEVDQMFKINIINIYIYMHTYIHTYIHTHTYTYVYLYIYMCVFVDNSICIRLGNSLLRYILKYKSAIK